MPLDKQKYGENFFSYPIKAFITKTLINKPDTPPSGILFLSFILCRKMVSDKSLEWGNLFERKVRLRKNVRYKFEHSRGFTQEALTILKCDNPKQVHVTIIISTGEVRRDRHCPLPNHACNIY